MAELQPVGYAWIVREHGLRVMPPHRLTFAAPGHRKERWDGGRLTLTVPRSQAPAPSLAAQLEFALRNEGVNLEILAAVFRSAPAAGVEEALAAAVRARPTGRFRRVLWYLYEELTGRRLDLPDLRTGNYVAVLDEEVCFTAPGRRRRRQRVIDNQLGDARFCPTVRRTERLRRFAEARLADEAARVVRGYDEDALRRAVSYLYTKETRSSFGIEGEQPSPSRTERFVSLLRDLPRLERIDKAELLRLQNETVEARFADRDYRADQVYVAEQVGLTRQRIHFVGPRPEDVPSMMEGLLGMLDRLALAGLDPVVSAAVASFGFVFIHPFSDGNGRLHRLLVHWMLARAGFTPPGVILPVSAVMLARRRAYDEALEAFSRPLMERVEYEERDDGVIEVRNATDGLYRYLDATPMAEALYAFVEETVRHEFPQELALVVAFREVREELARIVDLPDRQANVFVQTVLRNAGVLSRAKRTSLFAELTDDEIARMEEVVRRRLGSLAANVREEEG